MHRAVLMRQYMKRMPWAGELGGPAVAAGDVRLTCGDMHGSTTGTTMMMPEVICR
jgi:hypothetical protein